MDECALQVDGCDENSMCVNNNGSYTCTCNDGFMMSTRFTCEGMLFSHTSLIILSKFESVDVCQKNLALVPG